MGKKYRAEILNSRLLGTNTIATAVSKLKPDVFISSSAIGWYGETGNRTVVEDDRPGDDFLAAVCKEWEGAADSASGTRTVKIRTGLVLEPTSGAMGKMLPLFKFGLGGKLGNGKQWWSWIRLTLTAKRTTPTMPNRVRITTLSLYLSSSAPDRSCKDRSEIKSCVG